MRADDTQASDVAREPTVGAAASVLHGLDGAQVLDVAPFVPPAPDAAPSAATLVACIPVPAFVCDGDRILASNVPAAQLVGCPLPHGPEHRFSRLFALPYRARVEDAMRLAPGACASLPAATLLKDIDRGRRVDLQLAGVELDRQHLTLVTATAVDVPLPAPVPASAPRGIDRTRAEALTPREREILDLVTQRLTSKAIAQRLGISHRTVETHRANLLRKIDPGRQASRARDVSS